MYQGYLEFVLPDGNTIEIANSTRLFSHLRNGSWISAPGTTSKCGCGASTETGAGYLSVACDPGPYVTPDGNLAETCAQFEGEASEAPWWCEDDPRSEKFVGAWIQKISGFDSTYTREMADLALCGSALTTGRNRGRCFVIDLCLFATDECGAEYAMEWLEAEFLDICGCGQFDMRMLQCCPCGLSEEEIENNIVTISSVGVSEGIQLVSEQQGYRVTKVRFTVCSEQPWLYGKCVPCIEEVVPTNRRICQITYPAYDCEPETETATITILKEKTILPVAIDGYGNWCPVGWQYPEEYDPFNDDTVILEITEEIAKEEEEIECCPYFIDVYHDGGSTVTWVPVNWSPAEIGCIPCDCPIEIRNVILPADDPDAEDRFTISGAPSGNGCCEMILGANGSVIPTASFPYVPWNPGQRDANGDLVFPDYGCTFKICNCAETEVIGGSNPLGSGGGNPDPDPGTTGSGEDACTYVVCVEQLQGIAQTDDCAGIEPYIDFAPSLNGTTKTINWSVGSGPSTGFQGSEYQANNGSHNPDGIDLCCLTQLVYLWENSSFDGAYTASGTGPTCEVRLNDDGTVEAVNFDMEDMTEIMFGNCNFVLLPPEDCELTTSVDRWIVRADGQFGCDYGSFEVDSSDSNVQVVGTGSNSFTFQAPAGTGNPTFTVTIDGVSLTTTSGCKNLVVN